MPTYVGYLSVDLGNIVFVFFFLLVACVHLLHIHMGCLIDLNRCGVFSLEYVANMFAMLRNICRQAGVLIDQKVIA